MKHKYPSPRTVEAVILGLAVGVPVLHLPFSLTVRVVILCLTALPLVLLALIGVGQAAFVRPIAAPIFANSPVPIRLETVRTNLGHGLMQSHDSSNC